VFLNNRYLDPVLGRFITVDPLVAKTGDAYGYAGNSPITMSDPTGLEPCSWCSSAETRHPGESSDQVKANLADAYNICFIGCNNDDPGNTAYDDISYYEHLLGIDTQRTLLGMLLDPRVVEELAKLGPSSPTHAVCAGATGQYGVAVSVPGCGGTTAGVGGWASFSVSGGAGGGLGARLDGAVMISNAPDPGLLGGQAVCGGGSLGLGGGVGVMACVSLNAGGTLPKDRPPTVAAFVTGSVGLYGEVGGHLQVGYTWILRGNLAGGETLPQQPHFCVDFSEAMTSQCGTG
jgi:hypothetical protein